LPRLSEAFLDQVTQKWLDSSRWDKSRSPDLPSSAARPTPADLQTLFKLMAERDLIGLLWADALWSRLQGTNRDYWRQRVRVWRDEIDEIGPHFRRRAENGGGQARHDYPYLSEPRNLTIAHLPEGALEEAEPRPEQGGDRPFDLEKFIEVARQLGMEPEELKSLLGSVRPGDDDAPLHGKSEPPRGGDPHSW
jgi:hypothetical protein